MRKDVGILTSTPSFINNYGAVLQAYALSKQLDFMGYQSYFIRYKGETEYLKGTASIIERLKGAIFNKKLSVAERVGNVLTKHKRTKMEKLFVDFQKRYLHFYNDQYINLAELIKSPPLFYAYVTGSDQVWNPKVHGNKNDRGYFLDFVPAGSKRIAYAPSMGVNHLPDSCKNDLEELLAKFDALSIREKSGADIIAETTGRKIPVVLDPTLLLPSDVWDKIARLPNKVPKEYILCYKFGNLEHTTLTIKKISKKLKLPIINLPASLNMDFKTRFDVGPEDFLGLIKNAKLVCTDSFHALVFSILFHIPFFSFFREAPESGITMNSRVENLLSILNIENRLLKPGIEADYNSFRNIDYKEVDERLEIERQKSIFYLKTALEQ